MDRKNNKRMRCLLFCGGTIEQKLRKKEKTAWKKYLPTKKERDKEIYLLNKKQA